MKTTAALMSSEAGACLPLARSVLAYLTKQGMVSYCLSDFQDCYIRIVDLHIIAPTALINLSSANYTNIRYTTISVPDVSLKCEVTLVQTAFVVNSPI